MAVLRGGTGIKYSREDAVDPLWKARWENL